MAATLAARRRFFRESQPGFIRHPAISHYFGHHCLFKVFAHMTGVDFNALLTYTAKDITDKLDEL
jgi:hypothetical protein